MARKRRWNLHSRYQRHPEQCVTANRELRTVNWQPIFISSYAPTVSGLLPALAGKRLRRDFLHLPALQMQHPVAAARKSKIVSGNQ